MTSDIERTVDRLFADHCSAAVRTRAEKGEAAESLWKAATEAGLLTALDADGDLGVEAADAFAIVRLAGRHAVPAPLPETMLANWLLAKSGIDTSERPTVVVADPALRLSGAPGAHRLTGTVPSVPWGRNADIVALIEHDRHWWIARPERKAIKTAPSANIALEPRDALTFDGPVQVTSLTPAPDRVDVTSLRAAGAALRCNQMAGAMEAALALTVSYASGRVQFGKPIAKFQAVQHNIAVLAEQTAAARAAADLAAEAFADGINLQGIAAAKAFVGEATGVAAGIAHQMHGAMGFTQEYGLHFLTRRLWSWREEYGNDAEWAAWLGRRLASAGPDQLWAGITAL